RKGLRHRRAEAKERLLRVRLGRAFVDQLREIADVAERLALGRRERRANRFHVIQADEIATLLLEVRDSSARHRLERAAEPAAALTGVLRDAALLAAIASE